MTYRLFAGTAIIAAAGLTACGNGNNSKTGSADTATKMNTSKAPTTTTTGEGVNRPPIINIMDTIELKRTVLYMKAKVAVMDSVNPQLAMIYSKLTRISREGKTNITGAPMAWFKSTKSPYIFEAGLPVDKQPAKLPPDVLVKETKQDSVVVAHFFGPYAQLSQAYEALSDWMKSRKKSANGAPYEIYIGDPAVQKDPYKLQTDVVFPIK